MYVQKLLTVWKQLEYMRAFSRVWTKEECMMVKNINSLPTISMVEWKSAIKGEDQDLEHRMTREIAKGTELLLNFSKDISPIFNRQGP